MPKFHGKNVRVFWGGYNLSGDLNDVSVPFKHDTAEVASYSDASKSYVLGQRDAMYSYKGWFNTGALPAQHAVATADLNAAQTGRVLTVAPIGTATPGAPCFAGSAVVMSDYNVHNGLHAAVEASAEFHSLDAYGIDPISKLLEYTPPGSTADGAVLDDNGAATAFGLRAYLNALTVVGTVAPVIQHGTSAAGPWVDLITFASGTAPYSDGQSVTGTVNRYLRRNIPAGSAEAVISFARPLS